MPTLRGMHLVIVLCGVFTASSVANAFTTVVIDPGHGGKDPGSCWNGLKEKNLCLDVAKRLDGLLRESGLRTAMTRSRDVFVDLSGRAAVSNKYKDAVFVSIHFNASRDRSVSGTEVHYRSARGRELGSSIQRALGSSVKGVSRDGRWKDYKVLRETEAVAVLVECGFISNRREAARCEDSDHRQALATAIARGLLAARKKF